MLFKPYLIPHGKVFRQCLCGALRAPILLILPEEQYTRSLAIVMYTRSHTPPFVTESAIITTVAGNGTSGYSGDGGPSTSAELSEPTGVAVDGIGSGQRSRTNLYIADHRNSVIRKVYANGTIVTVAGTDTPGYSGDGGPATSAQLNWSFGIAVDITCHRCLQGTGPSSSHEGQNRKGA